MMKKSIKVKGIKNLEKVNQNEIKAGTDRKCSDGGCTTVFIDAAEELQTVPIYIVLK